MSKRKTHIYDINYMYPSYRTTYDIKDFSKIFCISLFICVIY